MLEDIVFLKLQINFNVHIFIKKSIGGTVVNDGYEHNFKCNVLLQKESLIRVK